MRTIWNLLFHSVFKDYLVVRNEYYSGGSAPPDLRQGVKPPGPVLGEEGPWKERDNIRLMLGETIVCGLLDQESQGKSERESKLSLRILPRLSPDALHPGWRLSAAGPEAQRREDWLPRFLQATAGTTFFYPPSIFRYCGSRVLSTLVGRGQSPTVLIH